MPFHPYWGETHYIDHDFRVAGHNFRDTLGCDQKCDHSFRNLFSRDLRLTSLRVARQVQPGTGPSASWSTAPR